MFMSKADIPRQSLLPVPSRLTQEVIEMPLTQVPRAHTLTGTESRVLAARVWGEERGEPLFNGDQIPVGQEEKRCEWAEIMII